MFYVDSDAISCQHFPVLLETLVTRAEYGGTRPSWKHIDWVNWSKTATAEEPKRKWKLRGRQNSSRVAFSRGLSDFFYKGVINNIKQGPNGGCTW